MAITASVQPKSGWIVYAGSDLPHPIWFCFSKEGLDHVVQNQPGSNLDGLVRFWPNTSGPEASQCARIVRPGFWQSATSRFPVSHFQIRLRSSTDGLDHIVQNQARSWCWLTVSGFGQTGPVQKQMSAQESSGPLLAKASKLIWIGCEWDPACLLGSVCLQVPRPTARRRRRCGKGGQPHVCPECGSQFARSGGLKVHMRIHTGKNKIVYCPLLKSYAEI